MKKSICRQNEAQIGQILGIDFGEAKVGLAIADEETRLAFAFDILKNDKELWNNLREIIKCENVQQVVLGMTAHAKDEQSLKNKTAFAQKLNKELGIEVALQEEMFTTRMAQANLRSAGKKQVAKQDDAEAARIILQSWLDKAQS